MKLLSPHLRSLTLRLTLGLMPLATTSLAAADQDSIKVMLLTGQSNRYHNWAVSSPILKNILDQAGIFDVTVVTSPKMGTDMSGFSPDFSAYDVVVMDYEGDDWPEATQKAFEDYMKNGGGFVSFHGTDNAFPKWPAFNEMIGVGGWGLKEDGNLGARTEAVGPKVRWRDNKMVLDDSPGLAKHPPSHDFAIEVRAPEHPIMKGMPAKWMHPHDEIYSQLRGPAKNLTVLATAYPDPEKFKGATGENEPMLMTITYGKGRIFHTTLGHAGPNDVAPLAALDCVGFITTLTRGTEWAATGKVTLPIPDDFPTAEKTSIRSN